MEFLWWVGGVVQTDFHVNPTTKLLWVAFGLGCCFLAWLWGYDNIAVCLVSSYYLWYCCWIEQHLNFSLVVFAAKYFLENVAGLRAVCLSISRKV